MRASLVCSLQNTPNAPPHAHTLTETVRNTRREREKKSHTHTHTRTHTHTKPAHRCRPTTCGVSSFLWVSNVSSSLLLTRGYLQRVVFSSVGVASVKGVGGSFVGGAIGWPSSVGGVRGREEGGGEGGKSFGEVWAREREEEEERLREEEQEDQDEQELGVEWVEEQINVVEALLRLLLQRQVCCSVVHCGAVWCSMLQNVAVCCSVLQYVAVRASSSLSASAAAYTVALAGVLQCVAAAGVLQCVAAAGVLQCVAVWPCF